MTKTKNKTLHRTPVYRRPIFIVFLLLILAAGGVVAYLLVTKSLTSPEPTSPDSATTINTESGSRTDPESPPEEPERPAQFEGEDPNSFESLTGHIAYRGVDSSQNLLTITASIDQYLSSGGDCRLSLSREGSEVYSASLAATPDVTTSVCGPFEIPLSRLSSGIYTITIRVTTADKSGTITGEVEI